MATKYQMRVARETEGRTPALGATPNRPPRPHMSIAADGFDDPVPKRAGRLLRSAFAERLRLAQVAQACPAGLGRLQQSRSGLLAG